MREESKAVLDKLNEVFQPSFWGKIHFEEAMVEKIKSDVDFRSSIQQCLFELIDEITADFIKSGDFHDFNMMVEQFVHLMVQNKLFMRIFWEQMFQIDYSGNNLMEKYRKNLKPAVYRLLFKHEHLSLSDDETYALTPYMMMNEVEVAHDLQELLDAHAEHIRSRFRQHKKHYMESYNRMTREGA